MISLKQLRKEAKRTLGIHGCIAADSRHACEAYRIFISKKHPPSISILVRAHNLATARELLLNALRGMPDFEARS